MKIKTITTLSMILIFTLLLSACNLNPAASPTLDPAAQQATVDAAVTQAMQTIEADLTSTAAAMPTATFTLTPTAEPTATSTPEPTITVTVTNTYIPPTKMPSATATVMAYSCSLVSTSPSSGSKINVSTDFDAKWVVKNNGTKAWEVGYVDLKYVSGEKMQTVADIFDINTATAKGAELTLIVDMKTPAAAGKYKASWVLTMDGTPMCTLPVNVEAVTP